MGNNAEKPQGNPTKKPNDQKNDQNDALRAFVLLDQSKDAGQCRIDVASQEICKLGNNREFDKLKKIAKMANELCEKFLCKLEGIKFKQGDVMGNLKLAQTLPAWKEIAKRLEKSAKFEVKAKKGAMPAMIIFEYEDGKTEKYSLELSDAERDQMSEAVTAPLRRMLGAKNGAGTNKKNGKNINSGELVSRLAQQSRTDEEFLRRFKQEEEEQLEKRCQFLQTPKAAEEEMLNSTNLLNPELLKELSVPLSKVAQYYATDDRLLTAETINNILDSIEKHYPDFFSKKDTANITPEEKAELFKILYTFGIPES